MTDERDAYAASERGMPGYGGVMMIGPEKWVGRTLADWQKRGYTIDRVTRAEAVAGLQEYADEKKRRRAIGTSVVTSDVVLPLFTPQSGTAPVPEVQRSLTDQFQGRSGDRRIRVNPVMEPVDRWPIVGAECAEKGCDWKIFGPGRQEWFAAEVAAHVRAGGEPKPIQVSEHLWTSEAHPSMAHKVTVYRRKSERWIAG